MKVIKIKNNNYIKVNKKLVKIAEIFGEEIKFPIENAKLELLPEPEIKEGKNYIHKLRLKYKDGKRPRIKILAPIQKILFNHYNDTLECLISTKRKKISFINSLGKGKIFTLKNNIVEERRIA